MTPDDFSRVSDAALQSIETLLWDWFPNGVMDGHEFCIGSRSGEAGKSLRIRLTGHKAGFWSEFSSDGEAGRDLISLYAYVNDLTQGKACAALAAQLGIDIGDSPKRGGKQSAVAKPTKPQKSAPAQAPQGVEEKKSRTDWMPILPVPDDAGPYPVAHVRRGRSEAHWEYRDQERRLLGVIYRFKTSDGGKEILPCVFAQHSKTGAREWRWMQFPEPRPLYLPGPLRPGFRKLVVEGEKCADAAYALFSETWDVASWPGGGKAPDKAGWAILSGCDVTLWPDADAKRYKDKHPRAGELRPEHEQPGTITMVKIAEILRGIGCQVRTVDIPMPDEAHGRYQLDEPGHDGWDIADLINDGATREEVEQWLVRLCPEPDLQNEMADDDLGGAEDGIPPWVADSPEGDAIGGISAAPGWMAAVGSGNVVTLRLASSNPSGASTPREAGAGSMTRRQVRAGMIAGSSPGSVKGCRENVYMALKGDPVLVGLVALDQFALRQVKRRDPPWPTDPGEWTEGDDFHLGMYLANHYGLVLASVGDIEKAVAQAARENGFNPVIDLFDACAKEWDGTPRVEDAFAMYWGAPASEYMSLISRMFFVGLAKRAYVPGVKHDDAPVFEGKQGEGKSTALSILGGEWFADTPFRMGDKDGYLSIQGILIYEIAELEQFNRSEVTAVKAFMSSQTDRYREPYGRRMKNQPRRTVFAATTNEGQYFKDPTGNRRFWPVDTGDLNIEGLRQDRNQLLGEAVHMMRAGVKWYPTREQQARLITPVQASREIWDEWTGRIYEYLEGIDADGKPMMAARIDQVTARELLTRALHMDISKISNAKTETMRISNIMRKLGWRKDRFTDGAREWYYERPQEPTPAQAEPTVGDSGEGWDALPI